MARQSPSISWKFLILIGLVAYIAGSAVFTYSYSVGTNYKNVSVDTTVNITNSLPSVLRVLIESNSTNQVNLTNNPVPDYAPVFIPDGQWIAFTTERDGNPELYVMKKDGTNVFNLTKNPAQDGAPTWK